MADQPFHSGPLQFIRIDDNGKCHIQEHASSVIAQVQGRLAVVGIAGLYRTGKSFLLNRLLGLQQGFEIGPSVNACTKGIWIWGQPVQLKPDFHVIFLDTEGLGSTQRTASCDMQIFSLCILLSSYFIYNSMGAIDEQAIDDLHLVLNLAKMVHVKAKADRSEEKRSELAQYFPQFLWVLRDFHLQLMDDRGRKITEREYLENAMQAKPGQEEKNKLRDVIKDLFRERDCATVVRPVSEEADLRHIQKLPYDSLRPQFRTQVEAFVKKVYESLKPKRMDGQVLSGRLFVDLATEYCKAINNSAVPTIQSAWTSVVQHQLRLCLKDAVQLYRSEMNAKAMQRLPMDASVLSEVHKAAQADAINVYTGPKFDPNSSAFKEGHVALKSKIKQLHDHVKAENKGKSMRSCEMIAKELYMREIENKLDVAGSYRNFDSLLSDWDQVRKTYMLKAKGPAREDVLSTWLFQQMVQSVHVLWTSLQSGLEADQGALQKKVAEAASRSAAARDRQAEEERKKAQKLKAAEQKWLAEKAGLERQVEEARRGAGDADRAKREIAQLRETERSLRDQVSILQQSVQSAEHDAQAQAQVSAHKGDSSKVTVEVQSLKMQLAKLLGDVRGLGAARSELEIKAEHERQLVSLERKLQKQLMDARRTNEGMIENLRQTYEEKVDSMKEQRNEVTMRSKGYQREIERLRSEAEVLRRRIASAENEHAFEKRVIDSAQKQAELVLAFLEETGKAKSEFAQIHEELEALSVGRRGSPMTSRKDEFRGRADFRNDGSMPYTAANAAVFGRTR